MLLILSVTPNVFSSKHTQLHGLGAQFTLFFQRVINFF
jgi:hypothetical protein